MVAALNALDNAGVSYEFIPLLHDMFPLHDFSPQNPKPFPLNFIGDNRRVAAQRALDRHPFTPAGQYLAARNQIRPVVMKVLFGS